ncbi:uncharacterized protein LOC126106683 isoform X1 [Schistocerca cancellata]|uniref:uncharacterized protein LOC126106683 isoform X1 n=1 Tax=Schistocerca cancellata TaxID=274614 RepID=UPI0021179FAE|nr:uncharacterized protein LOC126106683 isoform X1 [Schistocerca cancellata]
MERPPNQQTSSACGGTTIGQGPMNFPVREPIIDAEGAHPKDCCCDFSLKTTAVIDTLLCLSSSRARKPTTVAEVVVLNDCCCGLSLKTGATIAGVLFLFWSLVQIGVLFVLGRSALDTVGTVYLIYHITEAICDVFLYNGAVKGSSAKLLPWLIVKALTAVAVIVIAVIAWSAVFWYERPSDTIIIFFMCVIYLLPNVFFLRVVYSYYWTLRKRQESDRLVPDSVNV